MKLKELIDLLSKEDCPLHIVLPNGEFVPDHFHVTEIGYMHKTFVDCGGTKRELKTCQLQVWTANDIDHRLSSKKLLKIIKLSDSIIEDKDLEVMIEYGNDVASQYKLTNIEATPKGLLFVLSGKQTDCLAPDKCGVNKCC